MSNGEFGKTSRLLNAADFQAVFKGAEYKVSNRHFLLLARVNMNGNPRLGLVVAKKNIRKACSRNRIKRIIRESFRQLPDFPALDTVVLVRHGTDQLDNPTLRRNLDSLWQQLSLQATR